MLALAWIVVLLLDPGAVMKAGAKARVDHPVRCAGGVEDVAIGGEGMG